MCDACDRGVCDDPVRFLQWRDQNDAWFRDAIRHYGWAVQFVEGDETSPPWAYTLGLCEYGSPELVVYGLVPDQAHALFSRLTELVRAGRAMRDGDEIPLTPGKPVRLFTVPRPGRVILTANRLYSRPAHNSLAALQAVWPDDAGVWPWEPGCRCAGLQPMPGTVDASTGTTPSA